MKYIVIDKKIERFVKGCLLGKNEDVLSIHLSDIGESFYFDDPSLAQDFLNKQSIERFGAAELKTGHFDYNDEYGTIHRYIIKGLERGAIISYSEEVMYKLSEKELFNKFGYLMDESHGDDVELLIDIMKCNGILVERANGYYLITQ